MSGMDIPPGGLPFEPFQPNDDSSPKSEEDEEAKLLREMADEQSALNGVVLDKEAVAVEKQVESSGFKIAHGEKNTVATNLSQVASKEEVIKGSLLSLIPEAEKPSIRGTYQSAGNPNQPPPVFNEKLGYVCRTPEGRSYILARTIGEPGNNSAVLQPMDKQDKAEDADVVVYLDNNEAAPIDGRKFSAFFANPQQQLQLALRDLRGNIHNLVRSKKTISRQEIGAYYTAFRENQRAYLAHEANKLEVSKQKMPGNGHAVKYLPEKEVTREPKKTVLEKEIIKQDNPPRGKEVFVEQLNASNVATKNKNKDEELREELDDKAQLNRKQHKEEDLEKAENKTQNLLSEFLKGHNIQPIQSKPTAVYQAGNAQIRKNGFFTQSGRQIGENVYTQNPHKYQDQNIQDVKEGSINNFSRLFFDNLERGTMN